MDAIKYLKAWPYQVKIIISLKDRERKAFQPAYTPEQLKQPVFSCQAVIWENWQESEAWQCRETIEEIVKKYHVLDFQREKINIFWKYYHLNDLHPGTPRQENRLKNNGINNRAGDYSHVCEILKAHHLYNDHGRKFGTGWQYWEIPEKPLKEIKSLIIDLIGEAVERGAKIRERNG